MFEFHSPKRLRELGVLGMNKRNADYIMKYNSRHLYPLVDDKLTTKKIAIEHGIAVPELYGMIAEQHHVGHIIDLLEQYPDSVIKPSHGSGGNGILVLDGRLGSAYRKASGDIILADYIQHHVSNILGGMYSLGGMPDQAILEYRVQFDPIFSDVTYKGVPDIRIIVFKGVPVTAMIRLPTRVSDGKANLHQGAIGVGINLVDGCTTVGVSGNKKAMLHPDTHKPINGLTIPHWDNMLSLAIRCADMVGLGYLGVDIVMDAKLGPLVLELNARPGLNVQLANQRGLVHSLTKIEALAQVPTEIDARIALAKDIARQ